MTGGFFINWLQNALLSFSGFGPEEEDGGGGTTDAGSSNTNNNQLNPGGGNENDNNNNNNASANTNDASNSNNNNLNNNNEDGGGDGDGGDTDTSTTPNSNTNRPLLPGIIFGGGNNNNNNGQLFPGILFGGGENNNNNNNIGGANDNNNNNENNTNNQNNDYVVVQSDPNNDDKSGIRIQLYWEIGYMWQEKDFEFEQFCMMHNYKGSRCFYSAQSGPCEPNLVTIVPCSETEQRQRWLLEDLHNNNGEFLIQTSMQVFNKKQTNGGSGGSNNYGGAGCMELMDHKEIRIRPCNPQEKGQRWYTPGGSVFDDDFFVLSQATSNRCLGNHHHPKTAEVLEMRSCARQTQASVLYWERA